MIKIACEMCGSNDLVKENGLFVCQHCGCKYTLEEARKLMVTGTVKVDTSEHLQNLYTLARRAKAEKDFANAEKYYSEILKEDPNNWEPVYYTAYCPAMSYSVSQIPLAAATVSNCLKNVFDLIERSNNSDEEKREFYSQVTSDTLYFTKLLFDASTDYFQQHPKEDNRLEDFKERGGAALKACVILSEYLMQAKEYELAMKGLAQAWSFANFSMVLIFGLEGVLLRDYKEPVLKKIFECYLMQENITKIEKSSVASRFKEIVDEIERKKKQKSALGLFKSKEKKLIQQQIDDLESQRIQHIQLMLAAGDSHN